MTLNFCDASSVEVQEVEIYADREEALITYMDGNQEYIALDQIDSIDA